ncbi:MAG: hypothetical protein QOE90_1347 [Thermoplasmata archaeon]|jgi:hypothetical protein|nr:hypothetical protein [Thermoplasmata archaeon]
MHGRLLVLALALVAVAGCVTPPSPAASPAGIADAAARFAPSVAVSKAAPGAEPVIASLPDGTLFVEGVGSDGTQNVNKVFRSTDQGKTWSDVTPPAIGEDRSNDGFLAVGNGGTVYASNVFSLTLQMFASADKGATWTPVPAPHVPAAMHRHWILPVGDSTIHLAMEALPPSYAGRLAGLPPVDAAPATPNQGMWYARSDDKGQTWTTPVQIDPNVNFAGQGNMVVSADGKFLAVLRYEEKQSSPLTPTYEKGHWYLISSEDGGATWKRTEAFDLTSTLAAALPSTAIDAQGNLYAVWSQEVNGTSRLQLAHSPDHGKTWHLRALDVGPSGAQAMPWIANKGNGTLGVMWYQASLPGQASKIDATWDGFYADLLDAATAPHAGAAYDVAPGLHKGNICARGPACSGPEDRRLLDYPWITLGPKGQADLVFASTEGGSGVSAYAVTAVEKALPGSASR